MDLKKIHIIAMDGLDAVGKSVFCRQFATYAYHYMNNIVNEKNKTYVLYQHFPYTACTSGENIYHYLNTCQYPDKKENREKFILMNILNRVDWLDSINKRFSGSEYDNHHIIIIADRYRCSNDIYNLLLHKGWTVRSKHYEDLENSYGLPLPEIQLFAYCDPDFHVLRLLHKHNKDNYENIDKLIKLSDKLPYYIDWYKKSHKNVRTLPIPMHLMDTEYLQDYMKSNCDVSVEAKENKEDNIFHSIMEIYTDIHDLGYGYANYDSSFYYKYYYQYKEMVGFGL